MHRASGAWVPILLGATGSNGRRRAWTIDDLDGSTNPSDQQRIWQ